jgi:hypothetical protein
MSNGCYQDIGKAHFKVNPWVNCIMWDRASYASTGHDETDFGYGRLSGGLRRLSSLCFTFSPAWTQGCWWVLKWPVINTIINLCLQKCVPCVCVYEISCTAWEYSEIQTCGQKTNFTMLRKQFPLQKDCKRYLLLYLQIKYIN